MSTMQDFHQQIIAQPAAQDDPYRDALKQLSQMELKDVKQADPEPWPIW